MTDRYVRSAAAGAGTGADWANAKTTLAGAFAIAAAGDRIFVSEDHAETQASAMTLTPVGTPLAPGLILCVNHSGTVPPVSADLRNTATITTTLGNAITFSGSGTAIFGSPTGGSGGMTFASGTSTGNTALNITGGGLALTFNNCNFQLNATGTLARLNIGPASIASAQIIWNNVTTKFGATAQGIAPTTVDFQWINSATPVDGTGSIPASLFLFTNGLVTCSGVDFSAVPPLTGNINEARLYVRNCRLATTFASPTVPAAAGGLYVFDNCDDSVSGKNYRFLHGMTGGTIAQETTIIRTSGASDGVTSVAWKLVSGANNGLEGPLTWAISKRQNTTGSLTATVETLANTASALNNNALWMELEYLGTSGYPLSSFASNYLADSLATAAAQTASTQAWNSLAAARQNSHSYVAGDAISVASAAAGTVWFCTTNGTTTNPAPGGYTGATDGASVNDGTAIFRAGQRQKLAVPFTGNMKGFLRATIKFATASATLYVDPVLTVA